MTSETTTTMVGPYRVDGLIGRGGMGEVFRAFDTRRQRTVALKLLPESLSSDQEYRERFRRESLAAASLVSPHVVPIHDFG
jgi:serine/threonine kinase PknH